MNKKRIKAVTFSGLSVALIVILLFLASVIDVLDYTACAIGGLIVTFILVEFGTLSATGVYFGASILALIMIPAKISALLFILLCGWYPFIKRYLERIREPLSTLLKLVLFNLVMSAIVIAAKFLFLVHGLDSGFLVLMYILGNFTFYVYDLLITKLIWLYIHKYRKLLGFFK